MIKILLVDDNTFFRGVVKTLLSEEQDFEVVGECSDGDEVLNFLADNPDTEIIVMDIDMKRVSGIEATKLVKEKYPNINIVIFTSHDSEIYKKNSAEAGANDFVCKSDGIPPLVNALLKSK